MIYDMYGFWVSRFAMGCVMRESWVMACKRAWETQKAMGYKGVWVIWGMCYEGVGCNTTSARADYYHVPENGNEVNVSPDHFLK